MVGSPGLRRETNDSLADMHVLKIQGRSQVYAIIHVEVAVSDSCATPEIVFASLRLPYCLRNGIPHR